LASSFPKTVLVVTPGCPPKLIEGVLEDQNLPDRTELVLLPPAPRLHYSHLLDRANPSPGARFLSSPARKFFSIPHFKWLRGFLDSSQHAVVLVPKELYQAPEIALASLLVLRLSGKSVTILRNHNHQAAPAVNPAAVLEVNGAEGPREWVSFDFSRRTIALELGRLIRTAVKPVWEGRWGFLYLLMLLGLLLKGRYQTMLFPKSNMTFHQGAEIPWR